MIYLTSSIQIVGTRERGHCLPAAIWQHVYFLESEMPNLRNLSWSVAVVYVQWGQICALIFIDRMGLRNYHGRICESAPSSPAAEAKPLKPER